MKPDSCPGPDGLPYTLYKAFPGPLIPLILNAFSQMLDNDLGTKELTEGIITIIYKKGDPYESKNYRPISLLNCDYKIVSKAFTNRLKSLALTLLGPTQFAFLEGRKATDNAMSLNLAINSLKASPSPSAILFLDLEKAYDSVNHPWLWHILDKMNINHQFIN